MIGVVFLHMPGRLNEIIGKTILRLVRSTMPVVGTSVSPSHGLAMLSSAQPAHTSVTRNRIFPQGPTVKELTLETNQLMQQLSFHEAFGIFGVPMLFILLVCLGWTSWLIYLALAPNHAANQLMNTGEYDNGEFWYINDADPDLTLAGAAGLVVVDICYLLVIMRMIFWRNKLLSSSTRNKPYVWASSRWIKVFGPNYRRGRRLWNDLTNYEGSNRKQWNAFLKLVDLAMETAMLRQLLQRGSPMRLTYGFAGFLALNALSCVANVMVDKVSALTEVFINSVFDLSAAVLFPILTLVYCYYNFDFDREVFLTYLEKLPVGSFEHNARSFADPSEIALFRVNFDSLRISSLLDFTLRISMNLALCFRFERVLQALIRSRYREYASRGVKRTVRKVSTPAHQNPVPRGVAAVFIAVILAVLLSTHKAITDSAVLCSIHPECVVYAYQWQSSEGHCPCLILIDIDLAPKTYSQWVEPNDGYGKVKTLAAAGALKSLQIINRQLEEWPEELRKCRGIKTIQLIYTDNRLVPEWATEFKSLETIQIEGKYESQNLLKLPEDLFINLPQLSMIHLGVQLNLKNFPPLTGVPNLQSLTLAWTTRLRELPSFNCVPKLSRLILSVLPRLEVIPDLSPLQNLVEFVVYRPSHVCCNGFVGPCDLNHVSCKPNALLNTSAATCLMSEGDPTLPVTPYFGSTATKKAFEKFAPYICQENLFDWIDYLAFPTKETIEVCDGKPFRQCVFHGNVTGICFNTRFQVLSCLPDSNYIALRRLQIEKGVGPKCDPVEEKWLGCGE